MKTAEIPEPLWKRIGDVLAMIALIFACSSTSGCGPTGAARPIAPGETVVIHTERAISADQVNSIVLPAQLGPRPSSASAAADLLAAKLCEYVGVAKVEDLLVQHAAGMTPAQRIYEPICSTKK